MSVHGGTKLIVTDIKQNLIATLIHYITQPVICHIIFKNYIFKLVAGLGGITEGFAKCPDSPKSINYLKLGKTKSIFGKMALQSHKVFHCSDHLSFRCNLHLFHNNFRQSPENSVTAKNE